MAKIRHEWCSECETYTPHKHKRKSKSKSNHPDLNLNYCLICKTGYKKQLTGWGK